MKHRRRRPSKKPETDSAKKSVGELRRPPTVPRFSIEQARKKYRVIESGSKAA